ncbi:hypothetical protein OG205_45555 [Lentzea sp. NBC_00516]|uniref:pPIWI_RE_Z domain-containing protein n=1 Tax=Lentzea sp. NBC_00516 TaxID=2903582 RepID=UPI002E811EE4|nr:hypothetical protein [Lentzea sp. NBC_00516]WUD25205.1 hypothetical protein OG205_45555 [Lentzea sp. NBC_00516]
MRDRNRWYAPVTRKLRERWPDAEDGISPSLLCQVELGLHLLYRLSPDEPAAGAWTLFSGYPFARAAGLASTEDHEWMLTCARHRLVGLRRRHVWRQALKAYRRLDVALRGFDVPADLGPARPIQLSSAENRTDVYDRALRELPGLVSDQVRLAEPGPHYFFEKGNRAHITITDELTELPVVEVRHRVDRPTRSNGCPVSVPRKELKRIAKWMEQREREINAEYPAFPVRDWSADLENVKFDNWASDGSGFQEDDQELRLDGMLHMVGMVGAGKSTLMTLIAVWAARRRQKLRVTLVVGDVAEQLKLTTYFRALLGEGAAAPVIGHSTRGRHVQSLHRRLAAQGKTSVLHHCADDGFDSLSTACPLDATRPQTALTAPSLLDAPCHDLYPVSEDADEEGEQVPERRDARGCPLWHGCPRNHAARALPTADIWIANMASLVTSPVSSHVSGDKLRHLELACLRSDIVIVDEADRVMMNLDEMFAPSATLVTKGSDTSWLDLLHVHNIRELARDGRIQLSDYGVADWEASLSVASLATNRLFPVLNDDKDMRKWVGVRFFNSWTLQKKVLDEWFPESPSAEFGRENDDELWDDEVFQDEESDARPRAVSDEPPSRRRTIEAAFDQFRDDPTGDDGPHDSLADDMASVVQHLLITQEPRGARRKVAALVKLLRYGSADADDEPDGFTVRKLHFTLMLAALHQRLDRLTFLWPQVEAALRLESTDNELVRRPPLDYLPLVPEAPMGNVLGFQYLPDNGKEREEQAKVTGTLRFFRCAGSGRELLATLTNVGTDRAQGRRGPHVVLMSGTSWAGTSTRAHVPVPVRTVLRPSDESLAAVLQSSFDTLFLYDEENRPISLSGKDPDVRPSVLRKMINLLGRPQSDGLSPLRREFDAIEHSRRRILLLVGSYREAEVAARQLDGIKEWHAHVRVLIADNADLEEATGDGDSGPGAIRRGDVASFANDPDAFVLVAPLLALERGHNILNWQRKAAFGTVMFLARPHPVPGDISLSVFAINDWAARFVRGFAGEPRDDRTLRSFDEFVAGKTLDEAGKEFRELARSRWGRLLVRRYIYRALPPAERRSFAWDQLVTMWQVIGRLVRGGVPARVVFVDAKFAPNLALAKAPGAAEGRRIRPDTDRTSLLVAMRDVLAPYFSPHADWTVFAGTEDPAAPELVRKLYQPVHGALCRLLDQPAPQAEHLPERI